jgi:Ca2+-binding RTX toxin-like protein
VEFTPGSVVPSLNAGRAVTVTVNLTESVIVTGIPTLQLNDNEVATYTKGTGTNTLTFIYTVQPNDNVADLQVTGLNLPSGATIQDAAGNNLSGSVTSDLGIQIDTTPPAVTEGLAHDTGSSSTDKITSNDALTGSGDPNAVVTLREGTATLGTATANANGMWTFTPNALADGVHTIVASETDAAGNAGTASLTFTLDTTAPVPVIKTEVLSKSGAVTLTGTTAEANDAIAVYDGTTLLGTTTTARNGAWSFPTGKISDVVHTYTATATDVAGNVGHSSNEAILGSTKADTLLGTSGNDIINGNGGNDRITGGLGADTLTGGSGKVTFVYSAISDSTPSGHDTITDFNASRDIIDFANIAGINAHGGIAAFEGKLTGSGNLILNAHSVAYIEVNGNTEVLVNTTNTAETVTSANASAADMEIVLVGIHLGLKSADFHHV